MYKRTKPMTSLLFATAAVALFALTSRAAPAAFSPEASTVLVTGANRGMGLEIARQYAQRGWNVIATARHPADNAKSADLRALAARYPNLALEQIDVTDTEMIRAVAAKYRAQPIDILINNASASPDTLAKSIEGFAQSYAEIDFDAARRDFDVDALGAMRMVQAFMPSVVKSKQKKIVNLTSVAGSFGSVQALAGGQRFLSMNYGASKAALNKYMSLLAIETRPQGVIVTLISPMGVASKSDMKNPEDLKKMPGAMAVDQAVAQLIALIGRLTLAQSGIITDMSNGKPLPF